MKIEGMNISVLTLIQKIGCARMKLQELAFARHTQHCATDDPEYYGPCTCGADKKNKVIQEILDILDLEKT